MQPQGKCKTKTIQADLDIFTHIPVYSDIFRNWSGIFWTLCSPCIFTTLIYLESWHIYKQWNIQNTGIFRTGGILRTLSNIYIGKLWETANGYNYFCKLLLYSQYQIFFCSSSWKKIWFFKCMSNFHSRSLYLM